MEVEVPELVQVVDRLGHGLGNLLGGCRAGQVAVDADYVVLQRGGGSHLEFPEGWPPPVCAGQRIYSSQLATRWLPPERPEYLDVATLRWSSWARQHEADENNC